MIDTDVKQEVEVFINETETDKRRMIKKGFEVAQKEIEELLVLLTATTSKVKVLRNELKIDAEKVSKQQIKEKSKDVLRFTNVNVKTREVVGVQIYFEV